MFLSLTVNQMWWNETELGRLFFPMTLLYFTPYLHFHFWMCSGMQITRHLERIAIKTICIRTTESMFVLILWKMEGWRRLYYVSGASWTVYGKRYFINAWINPSIFGWKICSPTALKEQFWNHFWFPLNTCVVQTPPKICQLPFL